MQETQEMQVHSLGWEDPLEKEMATHSSILAWEISGTEKPVRLQPTGVARESDVTYKPYRSLISRVTQLDLAIYHLI